MIHRIPSVMGILLVSMLAQSVSDRIAHAQEQSSPTLLNSDVRLQADIAFWQSIEDSEDPPDIKDYLEQFPDGQFVALAHRRLRAKIAIIPICSSTCIFLMPNCFASGTTNEHMS